MKVQIINQAMTEEHIDNLDNEIEVLVLIDCYSDVKINNLPFGLKYLVFSYSGEYIINYAECEKIPFGCETLYISNSEKLSPNKKTCTYAFDDNKLLKILKEYNKKEIAMIDYNYHLSIDSTRYIKNKRIHSLLFNILKKIKSGYNQIQ